MILSGSGADGSLGLRASRKNGGLVIAQDPDEAGYDGMPRSAIMTGAVDFVLPVAKMPEALIKFNRRLALRPAPRACGRRRMTQQDWLPEIIELLRTKTAHDFTLYKQGTLRRRIERRMAMAAIETDDMDRYLGLAAQRRPTSWTCWPRTADQRHQLFPRSEGVRPAGGRIVPELIRGRTVRAPAAHLGRGMQHRRGNLFARHAFREQITAAKRNVKLQVFASDVDPDAIARAREGLYPEAIAADVSPARLARFFTKDEHGYRIVPELRALVVFTVQDVLADPPFSRIDLVSCRNLLIYLRPEAQAKVHLVVPFRFA